MPPRAVVARHAATFSCRQGQPRQDPRKPTHNTVGSVRRNTVPRLEPAREQRRDDVCDHTVQFCICGSPWRRLREVGRGLSYRGGDSVRL